MQRTSRILIILQTLGVELATLAAMDRVTTIQYSGPLLSATSLVIAYISFRRNRPRGLCFGLATPTASVFCFSLICGSRWGPDDAQRPMFIILAMVAVLHVAAAYFAIEELAATKGDDRKSVPFQFSIMALLVLMLLVAVFFALYKTFGQEGAALGASFDYAVVVAYLLRRFHLMRSQCKEE
jgi:hypothetical protein